MSINLLPPGVVLEIFEYLNEREKFYALSVFDNWKHTFMAYSKLWNNYYFRLDETFVEDWFLREAHILPNIPFKNVEIEIDFEDEDEFPEDINLNPYVQVLRRYKNSIVNARFKTNFLDSAFVTTLLNNLENLTHLEIHGELTNEDVFPRRYRCSRLDYIQLPKLKSLMIKTNFSNDDSSDSDNEEGFAYREFMEYHTFQTIECFKYNESIEKLNLELYYLHDLEAKDLNEVIETLPNLKHFILRAPKKDRPIDNNFPAKLETLEISLLPSIYTLLETQKNTLQRLVMLGPPNAYLGNLDEKLLEYVKKEMKLKEFVWGKTDVIVNYKMKIESD